MNDRRSRREFMGLTAAGAAGTLAGSWPGDVRAAFAPRTSPSPDADLVVFNARVYTMDAAAPRAEAFATDAGRFVAVGRTADIKGLIGKQTRTFDAKQMTIARAFR